MKSRIAAFLTVVGLVGGTWGALALAGTSAGGQSAAAGQYCATSCTPTSTTTSTPTTTPTTTPTPTPTPPKSVSVSSHTLSNGNPVKLGFSLSKPGTVHVKLLRTVNGKTRVVGAITITFTKAGKHSIKVTTRIGGHTLGKGNYTLSLQTCKGKKTSKAVKTKLTVR